MANGRRTRGNLCVHVANEGGCGDLEISTILLS